MGQVNGTFIYNGKPMNGATAKLWQKDGFASPPEYDDDEPDAGYQVGSTITTGVDYGGDGAFRWTDVPDGEYYVSCYYDNHRCWLFGEVGLTATITFIIDGGGVAITTGLKGFVEVPFACEITQITMLADQSGSIVVDIWKDTYANFPPTDADSITASAPPTISSAQKSQDSTLTGWTTDVVAGDILAFNVDSCTDIEKLTLSLKVTKG